MAVFRADVNAVLEKPLDMAVCVAQVHSLIQFYMEQTAGRTYHPLIFGTELIIDPTYRHVVINGEENQISDLQMQKELLQFDVSSLQAQRRYEHSKTEQSKQQRQDIENEISTLLEKQNSLQEFLQENISFVNNWTKETAKKIKKANTIVAEYEEYTNEMDRQYVEELHEAVLRALGDIPEAPEIDFEAPTANFSTYDEEKYELC